MTKKMKCYYFAPHPVQYHFGIYKELAKLESIDFKVIYEDDIGIRPVFVKEFNKEIKWNIDLLKGYSYEFIKNYNKNSEGGFFARVNFGIIKKILVDKPDIVIFNGYVNFSDWLVYITSKLSRTKIIFRGEATLRGDEHNGSLRQMLKKKFLKNWLKACDAVLYSCTGNKKYWEYYGVDESKMFPIPCAVDNEFFRIEHDKFLPLKSRIKKKLGINESDFVILFAARFTARKRPFDLLEAISKIDNRNITVLFVGDGLERQNIENFVDENNLKAIFVGFIDQSEISKYYSISDLDIVISEYDPSPKAMNEAMNFELPILVTDIVGTGYDLVKDGYNGYIVKVGDVENIAKKIDHLNKNREIAKNMGKRSLEIVNEWTFEKDAEYLDKAMQYVMKNK